MLMRYYTTLRLFVILAMLEVSHSYAYSNIKYFQTSIIQSNKYLNRNKYLLKQTYTLDKICGRSQLLYIASSSFDNSLKNTTIETTGSKQPSVKRMFLKMLPGSMGFFLGDFLTQILGGFRGRMAFDIFRSLRISMIGLLGYGPAALCFYEFLDGYIKKEENISSNINLVDKSKFTKVLLEQFLFVPLVTIWTFIFNNILITITQLFHHKILGKALVDATVSISSSRSKIYLIVFSNLIIRSFAHFMNYFYLTASNRLIFFNFITVILNMVFSAVLHSKSVFTFNS